MDLAQLGDDSPVRCARLSIASRLHAAAAYRGIVISIDSHGILDKRISEKWIPWTAVEDVSIRYVYPATFVFVRLRPEYKASFPVSVHARLASVINRPFFGDGYWIALVGLSGRKADFLTAVADYWNRFKGGI